MALGDAIIEPPPTRPPRIVPRLIDAFEHGATPAPWSRSQVVAGRSCSRYGIVIAGDRPRRRRPFDVSDVVEKPDPASVPQPVGGRGPLRARPAVFAALRETAPDAGGEVQLADALQGVIDAGGRVVARAARPRRAPPRHRLGRGLLRAFLEYALQRSAARERVARTRGPELLDERRLTRAAPRAARAALAGNPSDGYGGRGARGRVRDRAREGARRAGARRSR